MTLLALSNISATFNTIDHGILLQHLEKSLGVEGHVLLVVFILLLLYVVFGSILCDWSILPLVLP